MVYQLPILIINQNFLKCWVNDSNFLYSLKKNVNSTSKVSYWLLSNKKSEFNLNIHQKSIGILLDITSNHLKVDFIGLKYYFILKKKKKEEEEASVNSNLATVLNFLASLLIKLNIGLEAFVSLSIGLQK